MENKKLIDELGDELCNYCPLEHYAKGTHSSPNGYYSCEGCSCNDAYEAYLDSIVDEQIIKQ